MNRKQRTALMLQFAKKAIENAKIDLSDLEENPAKLKVIAGGLGISESRVLAYIVGLRLKKPSKKTLDQLEETAAIIIDSIITSAWMDLIKSRISNMVRVTGTSEEVAGTFLASLLIEALKKEYPKA